MIRTRQDSGNKFDDLLDMLLDARYEDTGLPMEEHQVIDEILILLIAGHETTAATLTWAFYLLSEHPEIEARVRDELNTVLNGRNPAHVNSPTQRNERGKPTFADLPKLTYTQQVVHEVLRLYPAAYLFAREAVTEDVIDGYPISPQTLIFITPFITHRNPKYWPDHERFVEWGN